ncbi:hypothetical protein [Streptomyces jumonjinensis]|uniref:hypothetical protein n=1 Tax=Streptomyces jumonjinensis TaxID=1945 RepID=UPI0037A9E02E
MTTTPDLEKLRAKAEATRAAADRDTEALYGAAMKEVMQSTAYGHLSKVAKRAGLVPQHLRDLMEKHHPGWLTQAAEERAAAKATRGKAA